MNYVVVDKEQLESDLTIVADSIREKSGTTEDLAFPSGFKSVVESIDTSKEEQEKTISITENGVSEVTPDEGKVLSKVTVNTNVASGGGSNEVTLKQRIFNEVTVFHIDEVCKIPTHCFNGCSNLVKLSAPNAIDCGDYACYGCAKLAYVDLGNITALRIAMLNGLHQINTVILRNTTLVTLNGTFGNNFSIKNDNYVVSGKKYYCYFYVPRALIEDYKVATNWSTYAHRFRPLEDYTVDGTTTGAFDESKI